MNTIEPQVIFPSQVEGWFSGVFRIEIAADETVSVFYEDRSQISARLAFLPHAVQSNFFALVRRVQDESRPAGPRSGSTRLA